MSTGLTKVEDLIDPEVMGQMISAKLLSAIKVSPFATIDTTLQGRPGDTITIPSYEYIGDAEDVAEGVAIGTTKLQSSSKQAKIKKVGKGIAISDEAMLSSYGDPLTEAVNQLQKSIESKIDNDCMEELQKATLIHLDENIISYDGIVDAIDKFEEEDQIPKVMFIHPKQLTQIRKYPDFKDIHKYPLKTLMTGVIGEIAGCQIVVSKKVKNDGTHYWCPIVKLKSDKEDKETQALTIYLKRGVLVETDRDISKKITLIVADEHYTASLTNDSKVVLGKYKVTKEVINQLDNAGNLVEKEVKTAKQKKGN